MEAWKEWAFSISMAWISILPFIPVIDYVYILSMVNISQYQSLFTYAKMHWSYISISKLQCVWNILKNKCKFQSKWCLKTYLWVLIWSLLFLVTGICSPEHIYYRPLQFCYSVHEMASLDFTLINDFCVARGGKLAAVTSQEMNDYFTDFLGKTTIFAYAWLK